MSETDRAAFDDLVTQYIDRLASGERLEPEEILLAHSDSGPAILEELRIYLDLVSAEEPGTNEPFGTLGDYTLRRQIGRGGMGVVYEAWENSMDRRVALKVLPAGVAADDKAVTRFVQEARLAGKLNHPNVVGVYGMGVKEQTPYYAMEFVEGETLAQVLVKLKAAEPETDTPFGKKDDVRYFANLAEAFGAVADGLQQAHSKGITHRDIKPSNLILDKEGRLRILDFGLARLEGQESLSISGDVVGTPLYMSPEQARRKKIPIDHRTDVYSLGATLYEMLTLRPPFQGKDHHDTLSQIIERDPVEARNINARVPKDLETMVLKCLRKDARDRYSTAEALAQDLRRFVRGDPVEARPPTGWELLARRIFRHRRKLFLVAGIAAFLLVCAALTWRLRVEGATARLYLAQDYEKRVVAAAMKLLRGEWVLATKRVGPAARSAHFLSRGYQDLLNGSGKLVAEEAAGELTRAIEDLPDRFEAYHYRAKALRLLKDDAGALADVRECLRRNPSFFPAKVLLLDLEGTGDDRERLFRAPLPDGNDRWSGAWLRAHQAMEREAWEEAAAAYGEILTLEEESKGELFLGSSIENLIGRGVARMESKDFEGAKLDFWAARTLSRKLWGDFLEPLLLLGKAYVLEGKPSRAEEIFREALDRSSDRKQMSLWIAAAYQSLLGNLEQSGRTGEAVAAARKAVQLHAEDRDALLRLGWALLRDDWWKKEQEAKGAPEAGPDALHEIETLVAQVIARNPNDPFAHALWSKVLEAQGKLVLASELAEKAGALLGGGDLSRKQNMNLRDFASKAAVAAVLSLGLSVKGGAQEPAGTFTEVTPLGQEVNSPFHDQIAFESGDGLTLAFSSYRPGGSGYSDMYIADRPDTGQDFTEVRNIAELNTFEPDFANFLSDDGLTLYFTTDFPFPGALNDYDIYFSKRPSRLDPFGEPQPVAGINSEAGDFGISLTADGLEAYFSSLRPGGKGGVDIWVARRSSDDEDEPFADFRNVEEVNTARWESVPSISADGLTLFWSDHFFDVGFGSRPVRSGGSGMSDIWYASRASRQDPFGKTVNLGSPINTGGHDSWTRVSPRWPEDGSVIYFGRCVSCNLNPDINLNSDIYQATWRVTPRPIFLRGEANDDGRLDLSDAVFVLGFLFLGTMEPGCREALDANDDDAIDLSDAIGILGHLFLGSPSTLPGMGVCEPLDASATLGCEGSSRECGV